MEEQKLQMEREMNEMREKMEKMTSTSPVAGKPEVKKKRPSGTRKPEEWKRTGQSTFYNVTIYT